MKKIALKILLLIYSNLLFSQSKSEEINFTKDSDTINFSSYNKFLKKNLNIEEITNKQDEVIFRFWTYGMCLEISKNGSLYNGNLTYFVEEVKEFSSRYFYIKYNLKKNVINEIISLIESSEINKIPSDKFINGWERDLHDSKFILEYKTKSNYSFKHYCSPKSQENQEEVMKIQNFIKSIYIICNAKSYSRKFLKKIPFKSYSIEDRDEVYKLKK